jgi:hypothetical protein
MSGPSSTTPAAESAVPGGGSEQAEVTPEDLLCWADRLLTSPVGGLGSLWPRACALVIRLALEQSLDRYWCRVLPEAAECGMRQQLLLLPFYLGSAAGADDDDLDAASLAREAWRGLARAVHHHVYELAPTAEELRRWHTAVSRLTVLLAAEPPHNHVNTQTSHTSR